jgi:hypothetical protein
MKKNGREFYAQEEIKQDFSRRGKRARQRSVSRCRDGGNRFWHEGGLDFHSESTGNAEKQSLAGS